MLINLMVAAITLLMLGLVIAWLSSPRLRQAIEEPKYRLLGQRQEGDRQ